MEKTRMQMQIEIEKKFPDVGFNFKNMKEHQILEWYEKTKPENPKAFPGPNIEYKEPFDMPISHEGMTLRDYFAAKAMEGAWASHANPNAGSPVVESIDNYENIAKACYEMADAMLTQRQ